MTGADVPAAARARQAITREDTQHIRPPGWYRVTKDGWVRICGPDEEPSELLAAALPLDLVKVDHNAEEVPLW